MNTTAEDFDVHVLLNKKQLRRTLQLLTDGKLTES